MKEQVLTMVLLSKTYSVCRLAPESTIPDWPLKGDFYSVSKTRDELSVVCEDDLVPAKVTCEKAWKVLKIQGPLDFALVGILSKISQVLADVSVSIFAISTFDTDYILVKEKDLDQAVSALREASYEILT